MTNGAKVMVKLRRAAYNLAVVIPTSLGAVGCSEPKQPPPGAPAKAPEKPPDIEGLPPIGAPDDGSGDSTY